MRDNKNLPLIFIPVLTMVIVANSDMHTYGKSVIFAIAALVLLYAGYLNARPYFKKKNKNA